MHAHAYKPEWPQSELAPLGGLSKIRFKCIESTLRKPDWRDATRCISMDQQLEEPTSLIFDITARCRDAFRDCTSKARLMEEQWAENRLADFNLWAASVGASTNGPACLDSRLSSEKLAHSVVVSLLCSLSAHIDECTRLGKFVPFDYKKWLDI